MEDALPLMETLRQSGSSLYPPLERAIDMGEQATSLKVFLALPPLRLNNVTSLQLQSFFYEITKPGAVVRMRR